MKEITAYQSDDGRIFRTVEECSAYEAPRIIEKYTNVDFCKRVEVRRRLKVIDRYLTVPGWKLEGFRYEKRHAAALFRTQRCRVFGYGCV